MKRNGSKHKPAVMRPAGRINKRSHAYREAEKKAGYVSVCLIGYDGPVPLHFGDNQGVQPVRIATAKRERDAPKKDELSNWHPDRTIVILERVHVETEAHAKRLKAALEQLLHGDVARSGGRELRHSWRDASVLFETEDERAMWWGIMLSEALRLVKKGAREFRTMDSVEREDRIERRAVGRVR